MVLVISPDIHYYTEAQSAQIDDVCKKSLEPQGLKFDYHES